MDSPIIHQGKVTAVDGDRVTIQMGVSADECGRCAISSLCSRPPQVTLSIPGASPELVGKQVKVEAAGKVKLAAQAMLIVIPLVLMVMTLIIGALLGWGDLATGAIAAAVLAAWFIFLYANRGKLNREAKFRIAEA